MNNIGYIYILTIASKRRDLSNIIKIGYASNVEARIESLQKHSAVWYEIEEFARYEIPVKDNTKHSDKSLHKLICKLNPDLKINDDREFFEMDPWDAYDILSYMAKIHERENKLIINESNSYYKTSKVVDIVKDDKTNVCSVDSLFELNTETRRLYDNLKSILQGIDCNLVEVPNLHYVAFKKQKHNVVALWPKSNSIEVVLNAKLGSIEDDTDTIYDISNRKWTAAQYAFRYNSESDETWVKNIIQMVYDLI